MTYETPSETTESMDAPIASPDEPFFVVVLAASAGGIVAVSTILADLPADFPAAVVIVQHRSEQPSILAEVLSHRSKRTVRDAIDGDRLMPGGIWLAPAGYHLLINTDATFALSRSPKVRFSRPAADPLLKTGARRFDGHLIAVILTGYDGDGAEGSKYVKANGGLVIAQDRSSSQVFSMPASAIATGCVDWVLPLHEIAPALRHLVARGAE